MGARNYAISSIGLGTGRGWSFWLVNALALLAGPIAMLGEPEKAVELLSSSAAIKRVTGDEFQPQDQHQFTNYIAQV